MRRSLISDNDQTPIEEVFSKTWDHVESYYERLSGSYESLKKDRLFLIGELRGRGFDRQLRAGQKLFNLILSRARLHGLHEGQSWLEFFTDQEDGSTTIRYSGSDSQSTLKLDHFEFTPELESLLERLLAHPID
jgi:hypothetical protein